MTITTLSKIFCHPKEEPRPPRSHPPQPVTTTHSLPACERVCSTHVMLRGITLCGFVCPASLSVKCSDLSMSWGVSAPPPSSWPRDTPPCGHLGGLHWESCRREHSSTSMFVGASECPLGPEWSLCLTSCEAVTAPSVCPLGCEDRLLHVHVSVFMEAPPDPERPARRLRGDSTHLGPQSGDGLPQPCSPGS